MTVLAPGLRWVDLDFQGRPSVIATAVLSGPSGVALIDPGPTSCLAVLESRLRELGIRFEDVTTLLLTHLHLDHAGAAGTIVKRHPHIDVCVHERGVPHLIDPSRLLASAGRLYGASMQTLWGDVDAVPADRVRALAGGERLEAGGRTLEVAYTPGHASHHVAYFDPSSGVAFVGDLAGVRLPGHEYVLAPTPPPDIDLEQWDASLDILIDWSPTTLFLTHFGPFPEHVVHVRRLRQHLARFGEVARTLVEEHDDDVVQAPRYAAELGADMAAGLPNPIVTSMSLTVPPEMGYLGLARYWRKHVGAGTR